MRRTGINISSTILFGAEAFADCAASAGFNSIFTVGNDRAFIERMSRQCARNGLFYEALHAPWKNINEIWFNTPAAKAMTDELCASVELAAGHGIPIVVTHLSSGDNCPTVTDAGLRNFDGLVNYAAKKNVILAVENQRKLGNIATVLERYGKETNVQFCWDVGHEKCFAYGREFLPLFGDRCVMTHIHDNFCVHNDDDHLIPFDGLIDFRHTAELIRDTGYQGTLMLEVEQPHEGSEKYKGLSLEQYTAKAYAAINRVRILAE